MGSYWSNRQRRVLQRIPDSAGATFNRRDQLTTMSDRIRELLDTKGSDTTGRYLGHNDASNTLYVVDDSAEIEEPFSQTELI